MLRLCSAPPDLRRGSDTRDSQPPDTPTAVDFPRRRGPGPGQKPAIGSSRRPVLPPGQTPERRGAKVAEVTRRSCSVSAASWLRPSPSSEPVSHRRLCHIAAVSRPAAKPVEQDQGYSASRVLISSVWGYPRKRDRHRRSEPHPCPPPDPPPGRGKVALGPPQGRSEAGVYDPHPPP